MRLDGGNETHPVINEVFTPEEIRPTNKSKARGAFDDITSIISYKKVKIKDTLINKRLQTLTREGVTSKDGTCQRSSVCRGGNTHFPYVKVECCFEYNCICL